MVVIRRWMVASVCAGLQLVIGSAVADTGGAGKGVGGGAAPATVMGGGQKQRLQQILAPYRADSLSAQQARQLRQALREAGFQPGPALDAELQRHGLSMKAIERLAGPDTAASAAAPAPTPSASTPTRKVPRPQ